MLQGKVLVAQGGGPTAVINQSLVGAVLEAIPKRLRNGGDGLSGRTRCDSERVFEAVPEPSCGTRPPVRTISERAYAMEAT